MTSGKINTKDLWIDLLCWSSAFKVLFLLNRARPKKIYYINASHFFIPVISFFEKIAKTPVVQIKDIAASEEKLDGISLYETVQMRLDGLLSAWVDDDSMVKSNQSFCHANDLNPDKFAAHLKESAYSHLYRPVEMSVWAEYISGKDPSMFVLRKTPFAGILRRYFDTAVFYRTIFAHTLTIDNRPEFFYDGYLNKIYFAGRFKIVGKFLRRWLGDLMCSLFFPTVRQAQDASDIKIGVELTQNRVRQDEISDISWIESSGVPMKNLCALQMESFDEESIQALKTLAIPRYKIPDLPLRSHHLKGATAVTVKPRYIVSTMVMIMGLIKCLFIWNESAWLKLQAARYIYRTLFWFSIYEQLNIKVLWTMYDMDDDKLAKGQAIELLGGLYTGGHWSNFPMYRIDNQKCFDVLFTWGEHFVRNNFNRYPFMAIFFTGYPCDYYFKKHSERANSIRKRYPGKFIISYHDNIMGNDLPYSKSMQLNIHKILISILKKFENVIVFLKPKRKFVLDEILQELPELKEMIEQGRVEVFLGDTARSKAVPAQIGMASDLVIGLGISTTAAECFFAGTVAFHADFTGFERNEFANRGEGAVVFRDAFTLENAIIERIRGTNKLKYADYKGYYTGLDPFMDSCSSQRVGFLLRRMREYLAQGISREDFLPKLSKDYDVYLSSLANLQRMSWN